MKILKVVPYFHPSQYAGGIETLAEGWSKSLVTDYGCEIYILTSTGILGPISYLEDKYLAQQHIQVNRMRGFRVATRPVIPHLALKLHVLIKSFNPDIVHLYIPAAQDSIIARIAKHYKLPLAVTFAADPILSDNSSLPQKFSERLYTSLSIIPTLRMANRVISTTKCYRDFSPFLQRIDTKKIEVVYQGVDTEYYRPPITEELEECKNYLCSKYKVSLDKPVIGFVGRLVPYKGIDYLLESAKELGNMQFIIVGNDPQQRNWGNIPPNVKFVGRVPFDDLRKFYCVFNITINPSTSSMESIPLTTLESMACGTPIIITDVGGNKELFDKSESLFGKLIPPKNPIAITEAVVDILNNESVFKIGARREALKYSWRSVTKVLYHVYKEILKERGKSNE